MRIRVAPYIVLSFFFCCKALPSPKKRAGSTSGWDTNIKDLSEPEAEATEIDVDADDVQDVCKDVAGKDKCQELVKKGECEKDLEWSIENCMLSCGACVEGDQGQKLRHADDLPLRHEQVVFETKYGEIHIGFFRDAVQVTTEHILKLFDQGCFNTNHISHLRRGGYAQIASVESGARTRCKDEKNLVGLKIPGEFSDVHHTRGALSMSHDPNDPNSGTSSFSIMLGDAPHLDYHYTVFGRVISGDEVLKKIEKVKTQMEGHLSVPVDRIEIFNSQVYEPGRGQDL